jgi:hypothetical protein
VDHTEPGVATAGRDRHAGLAQVLLVERILIRALAAAPTVRDVPGAHLGGRVDPVNRLRSALLTSTRRILRFGQIADTMSTSSEISPAQLGSDAGSGLAAPFWLTLRKQPLAVVQAGRPNCDR